jgi:hypothetical protein
MFVLVSVSKPRIFTGKGTRANEYILRECLKKSFHLQKKKPFSQMEHETTGIAPANKTQGINYELRINVVYLRADAGERQIWITPDAIRGTASLFFATP